MATDQRTADDIVATIRQWVDREVIPNASALEHADEFPQRMFEQMCEFGLFGATVPTGFGGLGLDATTYARIIEELSRGWMSLAGLLNTHKIAVSMITRYGTEAQRQEFLPKMVDGSYRAAFSLSEPDAGSDARNLRCTAVRDGGHWVINGTKMWVTNGRRARLVMLLARTPDDRISCFLVEKEPGPSFEGISVSKEIAKLGYRGIETVEMAYASHRVPHERVLGGDDGIGNGLRYALSALEVGRINIAARAVGVGQAAFDRAMAYSQERETFGKKIFEHQAIQFKLAEMATKLRAARLMTYDAARRFDSGERVDLEAGMAKLFASEAAFEIATEALRIHGGNGYANEYDVERYFRDTPLMIIGEGTNEIQRMVIARKLRERVGSAEIAMMATRESFGRYYEDFRVGEVIEHWPGRTITEADNLNFSLLTMNQHPLHIDAAYAEQTEFGQRLVVGPLVFSVVVGMTVADISGKAVANLAYENIDHVGPTFHGDTLYAVTEILETRESKSRPGQGIVRVETHGRNQRDEAVIRFRRSVLVPRRPGASA